MRIRIGPSLLLAGVVATALYTSVTIQRSGATVIFLENRRCCQLSFMRNLQVTLDVDRYRVGAWTIEHNREEPKRSQLVALLAQHGYLRVNEWHQDDYFVPVDTGN